MAETISTKASAAIGAEAQTSAGAAHAGSISFMKGGEPLFIDRGSDVGVLMLHGLTSTPHQFREMSKYLVERGYTVYSPLIAGHGTSPRELSDTTAEDWAASAEDALLYLRRHVKRVIVVGNSFGGNLAFWLAYRFPELVSGVVSLGTAITLRWHKLIWLRLFTYGWFMQFHRKAGREYKVDYIDLSDQVSYPVIPTKSMREFLRFLRTKTIATLKDITTPTLMIQADKDPVVHPKSAQFIHQHLASDYKKMYWLNGRYHNLQDIDRREEIFRKVNEFIGDLTQHD